MTDWSAMAPFRQRLDALDEEIITLFAKRYAIRRDVHAAKAQNNLPVQDPNRIEDVVAKAKANAAKHNVPTDFAEALYRLVIDYSQRYETECKS